MNNTNSAKLFNQALDSIPGGVNSPVRAFSNVGGTPIFIKRAKGAYLFDEDDNSYVDYVNSWGPMIFGHAFPPVVSAISRCAGEGTSFGAPTQKESEIAELVIKMVPNIDQIRFVNSGTEACMSAVRLARGYTGRKKIIKFEGCYHGHADAFLVSAGSGLSTFGVSSSAGVTPGASGDTLISVYNDLDSVEACFKKFGPDIAAVIVEPVSGNMGCVAPDAGFLQGLRNMCDTFGALLIFDEVMTGFRLARGGAQEYFGIIADIITFGKVIGGGLPVGAFAGRREVMQHLSPLGKVYQAGTLSGNPLAMAAGIEMLGALNKDPDVYQRLEDKGKYLETRLNGLIAETGIGASINRVGSMMSFFIGKEKTRRYREWSEEETGIFAKIFHGLLESGIYLPPSPYESWFLSDALQYYDLDFTISTFKRVLYGIG